MLGPSLFGSGQCDFGVTSRLLSTMFESRLGDVLLICEMKGITILTLDPEDPVATLLHQIR